MNKKVTGEDLEAAYAISAGIVRDHGEKYLPIFKRLHDEVMQYRANQDLMQIAFQVADENKKAP